MTRYAIGLGSNLGDRLEHLRYGIEGLRALGGVEVSPLYETAPVGGPEQDPYLNAVAILECDHEPEELLVRFQAIETAHGRERTVRWGARTLDLDIVTAGDLVVDTPVLKIPHPRAHEREFVLRPLVEVWSEASLGQGVSARQALDSCPDQGVDRVATRWVDSLPTWKGWLFVGVQMGWFVAIAIALAWDGSLPASVVEPIRILGVPVAVIGAALAFVASRRLGPGLTSVPEPKQEGDLVQNGPYRLARHPMYGGVTLFVVGTSLILDSAAGVLLSLGLIGFFLVKSVYEERMLRIRYPGYREYRESVTRRLIPFVF